MSLEYREYAPSAPLAPWVECFWTLKGPGGAGVPPERILPDARAELVWNLADPFLRHGRDGHIRRQGEALIVGQITGPIVLQPTGAIDLLGVRLRSEALGAFLAGVPAHELTDQDCAIQQVIPARLGTLAEAVAGARTADARIEVVEARLLADLDCTAPVDRRVAAAVAQLTSTHGSAPIGEVASAVGLGRRQLERRFLSEVGIGPKRFARIARFRNVVSDPEAVVREGWARIAVRGGYFDQAHLIRDFREFAGAPPGELLATGVEPLTEAFLGSS